LYQTTLFGDQPIEQHHIVNAALVPQRSPFRYPGGKTWLVPYIRRWLKTRDHSSSYLLEPFAGGAIVSLTAAFEQLVEHVIMVERDEEVAAVWNTIMRDDGEWLAHEIMRFMLTPETVHKVLNQSELLVAVDLCDRARRNLGKSCSDNNHG
jgi:DNA adenine methylase